MTIGAGAGGVPPSTGGRQRRSASEAWRAAGTALLAALLALAACSQPPVPRDQFYRLSGAPPPQPYQMPPIEGTVVVERLRADGLLSQRPILYTSREWPNRLEQHNYQYWVESPPEMLSAVLLDYMRAANLATDVAEAGSRRPAGCRLTGTLRRMEQVVTAGAPSLAVIEVELMLERINDRALLLHRTYRAEQPAADLDMAATAQAFDSALAALLARFASDLAAAPLACPAPIR